MKSIGILLVALGLILFLNQSVYSHCEIPCGVYGDEMRFEMIEEHLKTIEKGMAKINDKGTDNQQIVRWTMNKETHATAIQEIASQYFLTQRIKPVAKKDKKQFAKYQNELTLLHHIIVHAMKAKQGTDSSHVKELRELSTAFKESYLHKHK
jgi:nickel superoxide dismutase